MGGPKQKTGAPEPKPVAAAPAPKTEKVGELLILNFNGNEVELRNLIQSRPVVILKFTAKWCSPCQVAEKALLQLAREKDPTMAGVLVISIDIDQGPGGYALHSRRNPLGILFNKGQDGKADLGYLLYVQGQKRNWEEFPDEQPGSVSVGFGSDLASIRAMLRNLSKKAGKR